MPKVVFTISVDLNKKLNELAAREGLTDEQLLSRCLQQKAPRPKLFKKTEEKEGA